MGAPDFSAGHDGVVLRCECCGWEMPLRPNSGCCDLENPQPVRCKGNLYVVCAECKQWPNDCTCPKAEV
jgi:hypothetical protein